MLAIPLVLIYICPPTLVTTGPPGFGAILLAQGPPPAFWGFYIIYAIVMVLGGLILNWLLHPKQKK